MHIETNISLKPFNTFGIDVPAKRFARFTTVEGLSELLDERMEQEALLILGGGSNMLFTRPFNGLVLHNQLPGIACVRENEEYIWIRASAGVVWHHFVLHCIEHGWGGVENLSLIPGYVGASPMQNIGAYGVEIRQVVESVEALQIQEKNLVIFSNADCRFGYRESVFKRELKDQFVITSVTFRLSKKPVYNTSYGAINQELEAMGVQELSLKAISDAVIRIRQSKLPDPAVTGNAGSFFKNPEIPIDKYTLLQQSFPEIPGYPTQPGQIKVPAGWLIEKAGWKGYREGDAGVHPRQALVLVNYGQANGDQIYALSEKIQQSIHHEFGITLEREVNIY